MRAYTSTVALLVALSGCGPADAGPVETCTSDAVSCVELPRDDAVHDTPVEWWYWTGHLEDEAGGRYGFQVTFFLFGASGQRASLANVAITDVETGG